MVECTSENIENAMCSKIYDLEDLIDIREYVERMEGRTEKEAGTVGGGAADDRNRDIDSTCRVSVLCADSGRQEWQTVNLRKSRGLPPRERRVAQVGINVRVQKSPKPLDVIEVQAKLERDLRSCMRCRFFYGNNRQCITKKV